MLFSIVRFFMTFTLAVPCDGRNGSNLPLDGDFCALFLNSYHSHVSHGMPLNNEMCSYNPDRFYANCHVER